MAADFLQILFDYVTHQVSHIDWLLALHTPGLVAFHAGCASIGANKNLSRPGSKLYAHNPNAALCISPMRATRRQIALVDRVGTASDFLCQLAWFVFHPKQPAQVSQLSSGHARLFDSH
jgi:hypothetical protein